MKMTSLETDGWDNVSNHHPSIIRSRRIFIIAGVLFSPVVFIVALAWLSVSTVKEVSPGVYHEIRYKIIKPNTPIGIEKIYDSNGVIMKIDHNINQIYATELNCGKNYEHVYIALLKDMSATEVVRINSIEALRKMKSKESIPVLLELLYNSKSYEIPGYSAKALGDIGAHEAIPAFSEIFDESKNFSTRINIVIAVGNLQDGAGIDLLNRAAKDPDYLIRAAAAQAMGKMESNLVDENILIKLLNDNKSSVRRDAAIALGNIGSDNALNDLIKMTNNTQHYTTRIAAIDSICKIDSKAGISFLNGLIKNGDKRIKNYARKKLLMETRE